jgi:hypothetical protein
VHGHTNQRGFAMDAPLADTVLQGCIQTFAYWDKHFLQQKRLLNAQTGEYTEVTTVHRGTERFAIGDGEIEADHYTLTTRKFTIDLWYASDGNWLALESLAANGHRLRYEER